MSQVWSSMPECCGAKSPSVKGLRDGCLGSRALCHHVSRQEDDMAYQETLPRRGISRKEMLKRVARFKRLKGSDGGLPDSKMPGCERTLYNVIGFQPPPKDDSGMINSPVGEEAARLAAIQIREGFNLGYCRAKPGRGPL